MELRKTKRGFVVGEFIDAYGAKCSIQKSSSMGSMVGDYIWLGCDDADPKVLIPGNGWQSVPMPDDYIANTKMHLTQEMVAELLPILQRFVETGELIAVTPAGTCGVTD